MPITPLNIAEIFVFVMKTELDLLYKQRTPTPTFEIPSRWLGNGQIPCYRHSGSELQSTLTAETDRLTDSLTAGHQLQKDFYFEPPNV